jgi:hypothetical protein
MQPIFIRMSLQKSQELFGSRVHEGWNGVVGEAFVDGTNGLQDMSGVRDIQVVRHSLMPWGREAPRTIRQVILANAMVFGILGIDEKIPHAEDQFEICLIPRCQQAVDGSRGAMAGIFGDLRVVQAKSSMLTAMGPNEVESTRNLLVRARVHFVRNGHQRMQHVWSQRLTAAQNGVCSTMPTAVRSLLGPDIRDGTMP